MPRLNLTVSASIAMDLARVAHLDAPGAANLSATALRLLARGLRAEQAEPRERDGRTFVDATDVGAATSAALDALKAEPPAEFRMHEGALQHYAMGRWHGAARTNVLMLLARRFQWWEMGRGGFPRPANPPDAVVSAVMRRAAEWLA